MAKVVTTSSRDPSPISNRITRKVAVLVARASTNSNIMVAVSSNSNRIRATTRDTSVETDLKEEVTNRETTVVSNKETKANVLNITKVAVILRTEEVISRTQEDVVAEVQVALPVLL
jgi:hypothetical protein